MVIDSPYDITLLVAKRFSTQPVDFTRILFRKNLQPRALQRALEDASAVAKACSDWDHSGVLAVLLHRALVSYKSPR
jgi:hypothetical protein